MALVDITEFRHLLACPRCHRPLTCDGQFQCTNAACELSQVPFLTVSEKPVLVDLEDSVISVEHLRASEGSSPVLRSSSPIRRMHRWALTRTVEAPNDVTAAQIQKLLRILRSRTSSARLNVLVIGGGAMGHQTEELYEADDVNLIAFDIYASPLTQFIADAHGIPLAAGSMDAVVIQAVLEHVLEPWSVVDGIHRVLREDGLVYADTPFLQSVHEGPYDFTRFTDSGHRALFKRFTIIDSGLLRGSGTTLSWCFADFVRALTRSSALAFAARLATFWTSYLNRWLDERRSIDSASSVFLLAQKSDSTASPPELVAYYKGAQSA